MSTDYSGGINRLVLERYVMQISHRITAVQAPIIPIIGEWVRANPGTISMGQGVVHYAPPKQALEGVADFLADPQNHKYKPVDGIPELLAALASKLKHENGIELSLSRVVVTAGGNVAFVNALLAIADPGDEIILSTPYYFNHEMAITMANCRAVLVESDAQCQLCLDKLRAAITPRTRAIVTVSPNNPSGAVYPESALRKVNALCRDAGLYHISDEAYENFVYGVPHFSAASIPGSAPYTLSLYSMSKAYAMASWRVGYMVIPEALHDSVKKIQDTLLICPPVISQYAAVGALRAGAAWCREQIAGIAQTRAAVLDELNALQGRCNFPQSQGAFYFLLNVQTTLDALTVARRLIFEHKVAVIPGTAFGMQNGCFLRVAYGALQKQSAAEGVGRLVKGLKEMT